MKLARDKGADLFVSIHADAVKNRSVRGSSVYVLSKNGASSEAAKILAQNQNSVDTIGGVNLNGKDKMLQKVIVDLSQSATIDESVELASYVKNELKRLGKTRDRIESAGFAVLKSPDTPSILVETAFISNPSEEKKLRSATHQQRLATSVFRGIKTYFQRNATEDTLYAQLNQLDHHTIRSGETLSGIAIKYRVSLNSLRDVNSLETDKIRVGQKLIIPQASS
jgi:N-acetylmuramoyl-L-alanine amidase